MKTYCSLCNREISGENSAILATGSYGNQRFVCDVCENEIRTMQYAKEPEEARAAIKRVGESMSAAEVDDETAIEAINLIFKESAKRADEIERGEYDFSKDEDDAEDVAEIPEELLETDEDRKLDAAEIERERVTSKCIDYITYAFLAAAAVALIVVALIKLL